MVLKDYRPINLIGVISKIISKVVAARLKKVIGEVISNSQSAFVKERYILDGPLVLNEVIGWVKKNRRQISLLKLDFEKAYDNVSWEFLLDVLSRMGFPPRRCMWVKGILHSARSAVLVNASDLGMLEGVKLPNGGPVVSHMFYADDALILGGRLTLLKAVLASLPVYYLSIYKAPVTVVEKIEKMMRKFLWVGCKEGKGCIGCVGTLLQSLRRREAWAFRFKSDVEGMWRRVIECIHGGRNRWVFLPIKNSIPGCWKNIVSHLDKVVINGISLKSQIRGKLRNGDSPRLWLDLWLGPVPLKDRWLGLFESDKKKNDKVGMRLMQVGTKVVLADSWVMETNTVQCCARGCLLALSG
ncbi:uncharacterized protein LOC143541890 [Bidens hawaiensis]|uniref:uncharacterized protein LOC143541890 n=1 Tax=Bidens hawaiensis TaxID=980011 RepID=UPI00404AFC72